jgi:hypothetical protein
MTEEDEPNWVSKAVKILYALATHAYSRDMGHSEPAVRMQCLSIPKVVCTAGMA